MEDINCLEYLKSKTQVDVDSLDIRGLIILSYTVSEELGPFVDCTSNQADAYAELLNPRHADLLKKTAALANEIKGHYHAVNFEELAMLSLATSIAPKMTGAILVMVNPLYSYSTPQIVDNAQRLYRLCKFLVPDFDLSRFIVKVPSTWEGLQACRKLKSLNVKTLATTVFSMEQAVLAAEAGCIYISPFLNELKAAFDETYHDPKPIFEICVDAQRYYEQHSYPIRVKACAAINVEQILRLAGVHAFTAPADQLRELASMEKPAAKLAQGSLFKEEATDGQPSGHTDKQADGHINGTTNGTSNGDVNGSTGITMEKQSFIDDESKYRLAFSRADEGKAQMKLAQVRISHPCSLDLLFCQTIFDELTRRTHQALDIFCNYQVKAEALMRDNDMTKIG
ncbi:MAG: hypothetical protein Q9220_004366 [cf. Caloplaca sp. 1 TL-2023]